LILYTLAFLITPAGRTRTIEDSGQIEDCGFGN
jgi:hypothetical protein